MASPVTAPTREAKERLLPISVIRVGARLRRVDHGTVEDLAVSIREVGLAHAIVVRSVPGEEGDSGYELVAGAHRLAAHRKLGFTDVRCRIEAFSDIDARRLEIDENLIRGTLSELDFCRFVARRLELWAELNPDQVVLDASQAPRRRGRPPKNFVSLTKMPGSYAPVLMGFVDDTARATRLSRRTIYRAAEAWAGLEGVASKLQDTPIAHNGGRLRQIAAAPPAERTAIVDALLAQPSLSVADAVARIRGIPAATTQKSKSDLQLADLDRAWGAASPSVRAAFLYRLSGRSLPKPWRVMESQDA